MLTDFRGQQCIVTNDTDVTDCVNKGWYRPFKNYVEASDSF